MGESIDLHGIVLPDAVAGGDVDLGGEAGPTLLILIRHRHWLPCQQHLVEVRDRREDIARAGGRCIAVGFSPEGALALLARHLEWPWPFLADEDRVVYARLRAGRARLHRVYTAATLGRYAAAAARGTRIRRPVEDTRQLGADALIRDGRVVWLHAQRSPDDRPPADELVDRLNRASR